MTSKDLAEIKRISRTYGDYEVVKALAVYVNEECETNYANNPGAVIHRDRPHLNECVQKMSWESFLRMI